MPAAMRDPAHPSSLIPLHSALLAAAVVLLIGLAITTYLGLQSLYREEVQRGLTGAERSAAKLAVQVQQVMDQVDQTTLLVKQLHESRNPMDLTGLRHAGLVAFDVTRAVLTTDRRGLTIDRTSENVPLGLGDNDDFKRHLRYNDLGLTLGPSEPDHLGGGWMMPAMRGLARDGSEFDGVVIAMVDPAALTRGFGAGEAPDTAFSVAGLDNIFRARLIDGQLSVGAKVDVQRLLEHAARMRVSLEPVISPIDGRLRFIAVTPVARYPLLAVVALSADSVMASYAAARQRALGWAGTVAALLVIGFTALWRQARSLDASRHAARRGQALFAATIEGSLDALWLLHAVRDRDGRPVDFTVVEANTRAGQMLKQPPQAMRGRLATELVPSIRSDGLLRVLLHVMQEQRPMDVEAEGVAPEVHGRWLHFQVVPVDDGVALMVRDITERRLAQQRLAEREGFLRTLLDALPLAVYAKSLRAETRGRCLFWNPAAERMFATNAAAAVGRRTAEFMPASIVEDSDRQDDLMLAQQQVMQFPGLVFDLPQGRRHIDVIKSPVYGADGAIDHVLIIDEDVTEQRALAEQLRLSSRIIEEAADAVVLADRDDRIVQANAAFIAMTGRSLERVLGLPATFAGLPALSDAAVPGIEAALRSERRWTGESTQTRADGSRFDTWLNVTAISDEHGAVTHYARLFSDISVLKEQAKQLAEMARLDALTRLPNRRCFEEQLERAAARARRSGEPLALVYLDLDGFKTVNDTLGHEAGDALLIEVARRLKANIRSSDTACRLGGDEFTVILENAGNADDRLLQCERLLALLSRPHQLAGRSVTATPSVGIAVYRPGESLEALRRRADAAMYEAKRAGKARLRVASSVFAA